MSGKTLAFALLGLIAVALAFVFWLGTTGGGTTNLPPSPPPDAQAADAPP